MKMARVVAGVLFLLGIGTCVWASEALKASAPETETLKASAPEAETLKAPVSESETLKAPASEAETLKTSAPDTETLRTETAADKAEKPTLVETIAMEKGTVEMAIYAKNAADAARRLMDELSRQLKGNKDIAQSLKLMVKIEKANSGANNSPLGQSSWWQEWKAACSVVDAKKGGAITLSPSEFSAKGESAIQDEDLQRAMQSLAGKIVGGVVAAAKS